MNAAHTWKEAIKAIESRIAQRIAEIENAGYEVDNWELEDIQKEAYTEFGWSYKPEEEEEKYEEKEHHYISMEEELLERGMCEKDFF